MNRSCLQQAMVVLAVFWGFSALLFAEAPTKDLVKNGGMEVDADGNGVPDDWVLAGPMPNAKVTLDPAVKHGGEKSVKYSDPVGLGNHFRLTQVVPVEPGKNYVCSLWLKGENVKALSDGGPIIVDATWFHSSQPDEKDKGTVAFSKELPSDVGSFDWKKIVFLTKSAPADAKYLRLAIVMYQSSGSVWIDDVSVAITE